MYTGTPSWKFTALVNRKLDDALTYLTWPTMGPKYRILMANVRNDLADMGNACIMRGATYLDLWDSILYMMHEIDLVFDR